MKSLSELENLISTLKDSSSFVNKKLDDLIDEVIKIRSKVALTIPIYDDSYSRIEVGKSLSVNPSNYTFTFNSVPNIIFDNFTLECAYSDLSNNTILYKNNINEYIKQLSKIFIPNGYTKKIACEYDPNFNDSFSAKDVPNNYWFKNTFYTKDEDSIYYPLYINRDSSSIKENSIVTAKDVFYYGAVNLIENKVNIAVTNKISINSIDISESMIEGIDSSNISIVLNNVQAQEANHYNSIVTLQSLKNGYILKDLSNLKSLHIDIDKTNPNSFIPNYSLPNIFENMNLLKTIITPAKDFNLLYIAGGDTPQTVMSEIMFKFNNNDEDLIENPDKYISLLTAYGDKSKNEPVTLASINTLIALIAHKKSNKSIIVTDSYYVKNILSVESELKEINKYTFSVPVIFNSGKYVNVKDIKNILKV